MVEPYETRDTSSNDNNNTSNRDPRPTDDEKEFLKANGARDDNNNNTDSDNRKQKEKGKTKGDNNRDKAEAGARKKAVYIRKYTANGNLPLHEAIVINNEPIFTCYTGVNGESKAQLFKNIDTSIGKVLCPADTIDSQNPLPYCFSSLEEFKQYLNLAKKETFESLHSTVESIFRKYVDAEEHYIVCLSADIIYSYFQDKFATTHYDIFVGDNSSGKNSALLVFKYLGYRVFYVVSASAPNYFTFLGDIEECQGCTAEDEAADIAYDNDKKKLLNSGYSSGGTVPKVELSPGKRVQDVWSVYCHKWFAMEELADYKKIKSIVDRSFIYNMVVGNVPYNIKDIIGHKSGDREHKRLYDELIYTRKLLLAFRLLHYNDEIPDIKLNIRHRNEELTKPILRLFSYRNDAPIALDKIRLALSKFVFGKNEAKKNSIEAKLLEAVKIQIEVDRSSYTEEQQQQQQQEQSSADHIIFNEDLWPYVRSVMEGTDVLDKDGKPMKGSFYSSEYGGIISQKRVTSLYKSKLKALPYKGRDANNEGPKRGLKFSKDVLKRLELYYDVPDSIEILSGTHGTHVTHSRGVKADNDNVEVKDSANTSKENKEYSNNPIQNTKDITSENADNVSVQPNNVSQVSQVSQSKENNQEETNTARLLISGADFWRDGKWHCKNCKYVGIDRFDMIHHSKTSHQKQG